jgi:hypothetical protein
MDLITANKQLVAIIEMLNNADKNDWLLYDNFYKSIRSKAEQIVNIIDKEIK